MRARTRLFVAGLVVAVGLLVAAASALGFISGLTANSTATLSVNGTMATVSGTVQCEPGETVFVETRLRQVKGPSITEGFGGDIPVTCDGTVQSWSTIIQAPTGAAWKTGKATLGAFVEDQDNFIEIQTQVRLTKG
jgi:hypothetical protein